MNGLKPAYGTFNSPMGGLKATFGTGLSGDRIACVTGAVSVAEYPLLHDPPPPCIAPVSQSEVSLVCVCGFMFQPPHRLMPGHLPLWQGDTPVGHYHNAPTDGRPTS